MVEKPTRIQTRANANVRFKLARPALGPDARMICIGKGPGPKNVLAERPDGSRIVVPYTVWKFRRRTTPL